MFLQKRVLKTCSKSTAEHPCRITISIKLQSNFIDITLRHGCSPVDLLHIFRTYFPKNTCGELLLHSWCQILQKYLATKRSQLFSQKKSIIAVWQGHKNASAMPNSKHIWLTLIFQNLWSLWCWCGINMFYNAISRKT